MKATRCLICLMVAYGCLAVGCSGGGGGGSDGGVTTQPMVNVEGTWEIAHTNAGQAAFTGCTGDLTVFNGMTVAALLAMSDVTCDENPPVATQNGAAFTLAQTRFSCSDGTSGTAGGGGTVSGSALRGQFDTAYDDGSAQGEYFTGVLRGESTLALSENRITVSGFPAGACNISPALHWSGTIVRGSPSGVSASRVASAGPGRIGSAMMKLAGRTSR